MLSTLVAATRTPVAVTAARRSVLPATITAARHFSTASDKVIILGAAGRDFHDFITYWSKKPNTEVKAFTAAQIQGIDSRVFPKELLTMISMGICIPTVSRFTRKQLWKISSVKPRQPLVHWLTQTYHTTRWDPWHPV